MADGEWRMADGSLWFVAPEGAVTRRMAQREARSGAIRFMM
jgi:hypothetical protein